MKKCLRVNWWLLALVSSVAILCTAIIGLMILSQQPRSIVLDVRANRNASSLELPSQWKDDNYLIKDNTNLTLLLCDNDAVKINTDWILIERIGPRISRITVRTAPMDADQAVEQSRFLISRWQLMRSDTRAAALQALKEWSEDDSDPSIRQAFTAANRDVCGSSIDVEIRPSFHRKRPWHCFITLTFAATERDMLDLNTPSSDGR